MKESRMPEIATLFPGMGWWLAGVLGACFGSFANLAIHRLPLDIPITGGRSRCPSCKKTLHISSLIPILSWLWLRGRCASCHARIPVRYLAVELLAAGIFLAAYHQYGMTLAMPAVAFSGLVLLMLSAIDLEHYILPDVLQIVLAALGVLHIAATGADFLAQALLAGGLLLFALALRALMQAWKKREALGLGDVKLLGICGLFLLPGLVPFFLFVAGMSGILLALLCKKGKGAVFPFGPALALALFVCILLPGELFNYFNHLIDFLVEFSV